MTSKHLPIFVTDFSTYHSQLSNMIPSSSNPSLQNWFVNECILLKCSALFLYDYSSPEVDVESTSFLSNPHLLIRDVDINTTYTSIHSAIKERIQNDHYLYFCGADDYYLPGKTFFNEVHINHDGLICGYDDCTETFDIYAYNTNWVCKSLSIPYKSFEKSLENLILKKSWFGYIKSIKPTTDLVNIDYYRIKYLLTCYLKKSNYKFAYYHNKYPIIGINVHDYLSKYLELIKVGLIVYNNLDWRIFRILWEHKKYMLKRIQIIETNFSLNADISTQYIDVVNIANNIRLMFARYIQKRDDNLLDIIISKIAMISAKEEELLYKTICILDDHI